MTSPTPSKRPHPIQVILSAAPVVSFLSAWRAAAPALAELGIGAFFLAGIASRTLGSAAPWFVLAACIVGAYVRSIDVESWALFVPGGLIGRTEHFFGARAGKLAGAAVFTERLLLAALACSVAGHYVADAMVSGGAVQRLVRYLTLEDLSTVAAVAFVGILWIRTRLGGSFSRDLVARGVWMGVAILAVVSVWAAVRAAQSDGVVASGLALSPVSGFRPLQWVSVLSTLLLAAALVIPAVGGGDGLVREAHELSPPRIRALKRSSTLVIAFTFVGTALTTAAFNRLVPVSERMVWGDVPLAGLVDHVGGPAAARVMLSLALAFAAVAVLGSAARSALADAEHVLRRLSAERILSEGLATLHPRFGTPTRAIDIAVTAIVVTIVASSGQVSWLSKAYAIGIGATLLLKIAVLLRARRGRVEPPTFVAPLTFSIGAREFPYGLWATATLIGGSLLVTLARGDVPSWAAVTVVGTLFGLFVTTRGRETAIEPGDAVELLPPSDLSLGHVAARPDNVLVTVRNPHALAHVDAALRAAADRDVIVLTVRLIGQDISDDAVGAGEPTPHERELFSRVNAIAERHGHPVRLLIVPAHDVFDAIAATVRRLQSSEVYVGESVTLSADEQARLLGEAWERTGTPDAHAVRLLIQHRSGRMDSYHVGAHPPALTPADFDLIHRVWLDASKHLGAHIHHHDVVRAALIQMEHQLTGPERDAALTAIRDVARPAEELAAVLHAHDYSRLRDIVRNRDPRDLAALLTDLPVEDQVIAFRVLPRKLAADVFGYLSQESQELLLKALAQEDVAGILNSMAPDDRTMFLEELPAEATRQLLTLLTPAERSVALTLLGYPERSVGRLMTPHYVAVREHWTVREVFDYVRENGQDSETLNVIYVVDDKGTLIDDVRIREFLLTSFDKRVSDLMDRRFAALTATDDQDAAVGVFRQYDRSALPVTDTTGMLIGIVTIDDVLDVAEAAATREVQKIGGSEALDEPYMTIAFGNMIRKRAGWLTALFLGEMLTATAMSAFEAEISRAVVLALFVPLIISSGGNSGSQASTLVIRALAVGEVGLRDWWRVMRRELLAGLALGAILGSIGFLRITVWSAFSSIYGVHWLLVAITVSLALVGIVLWGTLVGSLLPFALRRLGFDPATSSAPFVATLVDVTGLVIYFSVATVVLRGTLL